MHSIVDSYHPLREKLQLTDTWPFSENWSAAADFLTLLAEHCLQHKPTTLVECSSGLTSLVLARCCQINGVGQVFSLENGAEFAANTREALAAYGLSGYAQVIDAPLLETTVSGEAYQWYAVTGLPDLPIDMLVIDGPPGFIQKHSRFPAVPLLFDRLAGESVIFLDDATREEEREIVEMWLAAYPDLEHEYVELERGCSVLRKSAA